ncbi:hypothetical protein EBR96_02970 [bacterium]|nr:hypothetical protein [bacterium]
MNRLVGKLLFGFMVLIGVAMPISAVTYMNRSQLVVDDDALIAKEGKMTLRYNIFNQGDAAFPKNVVEISGISSTINASTANNTNSHAYLVTMAAIKAYIDNKAFNTVNEIDSIVNQKLAGSSLVGTICFFSAAATENADNKWIECDGRAVSQAAYPVLYSVIGNTYNNSPGPGDFNVPNMTGRVLVGANGGTFSAGSTGGQTQFTIVGTQFPAHSHSLISDPHNHSVLYQQVLLDHDGGSTESTPVFDERNGGLLNTYTFPSVQTGVALSSTTGGGQPHSLMQPYRVLRAYIRAKP